jgi:anaerobic magnesium-protoporphyrin IX monomethyl ester cyclase
MRRCPIFLRMIPKPSRHPRAKRPLAKLSHKPARFSVNVPYTQRYNPTNMFRKIMLMNPPSELYRRDDRCQSKVDDQTVRVIFPPIELGVLASIVRQHDCEVILRDYPTTGADHREYSADLDAFQPDVILLNSTAHTIEQDLRAFEIAREKNPKVFTIAKGEAVAVQAESIMSTHPELDVVLDGEPEDTFRELITGNALSETLGIFWRNSNGQVIKNAERPFIKSLDDLPFTARDLFDNELYRSPENGRKITAIYAQRGCPAKCIFCPAGSLFNYTVRERSVPSVIAEMRECVEKYGIRDFLFHGDTFTLHKKWLIELCKAIIDSGLDIHWGCNSRVDTIDDERAEWLKKAGCWVVAFGFEHGSQDMLDKMKKGARVSKAYDAVKICRRAGLKIQGFFVIGIPWETRATLEESFRFVQSLDLDFFDFNIAYPLPGTEYYDIVLREGLFDRPDPKAGGYAQAAVRTYELTSEELTQWRRKALLRMYSKPRFIMRTLKNATQSGNTRHYAKAAMNRLASLFAN